MLSLFFVTILVTMMSYSCQEQGKLNEPEKLRWGNQISSTWKTIMV